jgi:hypothetical protein
MERDDLIVNDSYSVNARHSEEEGKKLRKKIYAVTALLTVMAPVLLSVADPLANRVCSVVGVIFEVPDVLVYQVPLNHSPPVSVVPVATVIADGRPLVVTEVDDADQVPVPRFVTGAT